MQNSTIRRIVLLACAALVIGFFLLPGEEKALNQEIGIYLFTDSACDDCTAMIKKDVLPIADKYRLQLRPIDVYEIENYDIFIKAVEYFHKTSEELPSILFQDELLIGREAIVKHFEQKIISIKDEGSAFFDLAKLKSPATQVSEKGETLPTEAIFFSKLSCKDCDPAHRNLQLLTKKYPEFSFQEFYVDHEESLLFYEYLKGIYALEDADVNSVPAVFIGMRYLKGKELRYNILEEVVIQKRLHEVKSPYDEFLTADKALLQKQVAQRATKFSLVTIFFAGLADGINPCAFTTIIFFVTYLLVLKKDKRHIFIVGATFIATVFVTYFLIGLGAFGFLRGALLYTLLKHLVRVIYIIIACVCFVLAVLSLWDAVAYKRGEKKNMLLGLSREKRRRINDIIRTRIRSHHIIVGTVIMAFSVSLVELVCTGQIYLPVLMYIIKAKPLAGRAIFLLVLYNIAFILPAVIVFLMVYGGMSSTMLIRLSKKSVFIGKVAMALLFFALAVLLVGVVLK